MADGMGSILVFLIVGCGDCGVDDKLRQVHKSPRSAVDVFIEEARPHGAVLQQDNVANHTARHTKEVVVID